jgi:hypothetical protein
MTMPNIQPEESPPNRVWLTRQVIEGVIGIATMVAAGLILYWLGATP